MATFNRFEELPVWQEAIKLADEVYNLTEGPDWKGSYSLRDQLERAALSVSNNIAEGFERGTTSELLVFLYIARGSAGEVRSMLCFLEHRSSFANFKPQISNLKSTAESCSRQLRAWADHLQNTEIKGQRHLNEKSRKQYQIQKDAAVFKKKLRESLPEGHPLKRGSE
ncbi:four helix bundle protein [Desulfonatronovibrio hydrogenovorans]|uniref:four helix bundle protein n=1 Tax=Desulfonatronovibrio hydrogenovorans TaxID=53245 RepID=UPI00068EEBA0|nr:four helix bundle protein [Desulfonatronovibrio hydrogenovorans]